MLFFLFIEFFLLILFFFHFDFISKLFLFIHKPRTYENCYFCVRTLCYLKMKWLWENSTVQVLYWKIGKQPEKTEKIQKKSKAVNKNKREAFLRCWEALHLAHTFKTTHDLLLLFIFFLSTFLRAFPNLLDNNTTWWCRHKHYWCLIVVMTSVNFYFSVLSFLIDLSINFIQSPNMDKYTIDSINRPAHRCWLVIVETHEKINKNNNNNFFSIRKLEISKLKTQKSYEKHPKKSFWITFFLCIISH